MTHKYVWPACIAAAAHGALLFGVPKSVRPPPAPGDEPFPPCVFHVPPAADEVIELVRDENGATEPLPDSVPRPDVRPEVASAPRIVLTPANVPVVSTDGWPPVQVAAFTWPRGDVVGPGREGLVTGGELDRTPRTRFQAAPLYPAEARRDGRSGTVTVEFVVDESGAVVAPRVASSSDRIFEEAALRAVAKWRFEPGRRHGQIVRFRMAVPIQFSLHE